MNAVELVGALRARGIQVAVVNGKLRLRGKGRQPKELIAEALRREPELVALLRGERQTVDGGGLPPPLGDQLTDLLDRLHAHGCKVEPLPDGVTFRSDCPTCGMAAALDITEGEDGVPHIRSRCRCFDPLAALEGLKAVPLSEFRRPKASPPQRLPKPKRPDAVCPCGSTQWRDVPTHGGQSIRRDCARCGRFLSFPLWYGHKEDEPANAQAQDADGGGEAGTDRPTWWPSWAQAFHGKLVRAGCHPKIVVARGNHGKPILAIEADCPGCGWVGGLVSWPLSTGAIHAHCRAGCRPEEVFAGLDKRLKQRN
jgi:hypothetical protein